MIDTLTDKWIKYTQVNNQSFEILNLGKVDALIIKDFLKYPDELLSLINELKFNSCLNRHHAKPGKTYFFDPTLNYVYANFLTETIKQIFGCSEIYSPFISINCFNGNMPSHYNYPHVDANPKNPEITLAANVGLTKDIKGGTGFWSYLGKVNVVDMTLVEINHHQNFMNDQRQHSYEIFNKSSYDYSDKWVQIEDEGDWKLECICPLEYNSLVLYSSLNFHNPYVKPEWYIDEDRISISAFFDVDPRNLIDHNCSSVSKLWKLFKLDTIHNINFN